ncbi:DUF7507 domain-containing protein [Hoeflea ulvae]|uniref:DUF7507 domain-containing protein n=1 Tax=Hoeflea ulvae TaxID=2983764 RepID=A0ABT3YLW5_9HYPH|nr:hypothetical protein [Hoeflea ulvae]MCY0096909.1 hypothetical protein [Hoeflea ulvae]
MAYCLLRFLACLVLSFSGLVWLAPGGAHAQQLVINNVGAPTVTGTGQGKRAIWTNAGSVGATTVDIVAVLETATLDHNPSTENGRPAITSVGQDDIWVRWYLYQAGTYNLASNSGGVPVVADVHVQFNDVDGPNNERIFVPVCAGNVEWVRIETSATTGRAFSTVGSNPEVFTLIGDDNYSQEPESGVEINYPNTSNFLMGRTADNGFYIRLDNPTYSSFTTYDFICGDFVPPVANDDEKEGTPGVATVLSILDNDANATANDNPPNNNGLLPSEYGKLSVDLTPPAGATSIVLDGQGDVASFVVPGEGAWSYDEGTGKLTFTPDTAFKGYAATLSYVYTNALDQVSNSATVTVWYPAIGAVKSASFNDESGDGFAQAGETITYQYALTAYGRAALENVTLTETGFSGSGTLPVPAYQSGDTNADSRLDLTETWIFSADYTLVDGDLAAGSVSNQATAAAQTPSATSVSDLSDSTNPADGDGTGTPGPGPDNNDPTSTSLSDAPILARDDTIADPVDGTVNQTGAIDLLAGNGNGPDTLNSVAATSATVTATPSGTIPTGFTVNTDGTVDITATIASGAYSFDYQICETLNPTNCSTATVSLTVGAGGIGVIKSALLNDENSDGVVQAGETVAYSYTVTNIGSVALSGVALTETGFTGTGTMPVPALQSGDTNSNSLLDLSESWIYTASYTLVAADLAAGSISNQATATGYTPGGASVSDLSDSTNPADGNGTATPGPGTGNDDPTATPFAAAPVIANDDNPPMVPNGVESLNIVDVLGNDTLNGAAASAVSVTLTVVTPAVPATTGAEVPVLNPIDGYVSVSSGVPAGTYAIIYRICEIANPANCDTATVTVPVDASVPAISGTVYFDQNSDNSYNPGSDPAQPGYVVELILDNTVVKSTVSAADGTYELRGFAPGSGYMLVFSDAETGIAVGAIRDLTFGPTTALTQQDQPIDPRGVIYSSATGLPIAGVELQVTTSAGVPLPAICLLPGQQPQSTGADGAYRFDIVSGASVECPAAEAEYRIAITGYSGYEPRPSLVAPPQAGALDATSCPGDAVPGGDCQLSASSAAPPAGSPTPYYLAFLLQPGDPDVTNNHIPLDPAVAITSTGLSVVKTAARPVVERGGLAAYTIVLRNINPFGVGLVNLVDRLPIGFRLEPGSATIDGAAATPVADGRDVRFEGLTIPAFGNITITLNSRVPASAEPGDYVNQADLTDPATGNALAPAGKATVRIEVDHVFDCGDVIGKVFEDRNRNGAQDTDERGLPGVRLATVGGMLITTDRHGRYNVPCAALPDAASGSNFILKLDTRTLPAGFGLTTENPRVVRLTRGKTTKMNFGVTTAQVVSVDLVGRAFYQGSAQPLASVEPVLDQITAQLVERQGGLKLIYHIHGDARLAESRLSSIEQLIRARWRLYSSQRLSVERRIMEGN